MSLRNLLSFCLLVIIFLGGSTKLLSQELYTKRYEGDKIRILQLTDLHWYEGKASCKETRRDLLTIIQREQPNLAILTGDIVDSKGLEGWKSIVEIMETAGLDFAILMGNHDPESNQTAEIYRCVTASPRYIDASLVERLDESNYLFALGNLNSPAKDKTLIYCLDTHGSRHDNLYGEYAWLNARQIDWVRAMQSRYQQANLLPSLVFLHIPLVEYQAVVSSGDFLGVYGEGAVASPRLNSGFFTALIESKGVMGVFAGHDHDNDFIGKHYGIALAYGRVGGREAYGKLERGGRIVEFVPGQKAFSSWIATPSRNEAKYYYPSGINSREEETMPLLAATRSKENLQQGINYRYYEGKSGKTELISTLQVKQRGHLKHITIDSYLDKTKDYFAYQFEGYIHIPKSGVYIFSTYSDDGSVLRIGGKLVVDNDGGHSARHRQGKIALSAGLHPIELLYFENYMGQTLRVYVESVDIPYQELPSSWLFAPISPKTGK